MHVSTRYLNDSVTNYNTCVLWWKDGTLPTAVELEYLRQFGYISSGIVNATLLAIEAYARRTLPSTLGRTGPAPCYPT